MQVTFERTGRRRYATVVTTPGGRERRTDPAPGFDDEIPHDLVHYLVEAELGLSHGVYGRAAAGGGGFREVVESPGDPRRRIREQRRLRRREAALSRTDPGDMERSERIAGLCDLAWRRRAGATTPHWAERKPIPAADRDVVDKVVDRLDAVAPLWSDLPVGGGLRFTWPEVAATVVI